MPQRALPAARKSPATRQARQLVDVDPKVISSHETPSLHGPKQKYVDIPYIHHGFHVGIDPIHLDNWSVKWDKPLRGLANQILDFT